MSDRFVFPVASNPTTNFTEALVATASAFTPPFAGTAMNNIGGVPPLNGRRYWIRGIEYLAVENVGLEFDFWASAAGLTDAVASDTFLSRYQFAAANGVQFNGIGLYRYFAWGLELPYYDLDTINTTTPPSLHVAAQNVDTVAKSADAAGAVAVTFWLAPMQTVG